jgi:predicted HTH transcriptional regulator
MMSAELKFLSSRGYIPESLLMNPYTKESQNTEWKLSWSDDYLKWVCGFANAEGGRILIGKDDTGKVVGLKNAEALLEALPNKIRDKLGSIEQLFQAHESIPRNPLLAEVCYKAGYIESWCRGVEKISEACSQAGLQAPVFTERTGGVLVELLRTGSDKIGDATQKTTQKTTHKTTYKTVSTAQKIVAVFREVPQSSRRAIAESLGGITEDGVKYHLAKLKKAGTIRRIGADKGGHWEVIDE